MGLEYTYIDIYIIMELSSVRYIYIYRVIICLLVLTSRDCGVVWCGVMAVCSRVRVRGEGDGEVKY